MLSEEQWIISNLEQEFQSVAKLVNTSDTNYPHWPPIARQLLHLFDLKERKN
jgi:hypothetical protein